MNKHLFNVIQLGIGFLFIFSAFNSAGFIQETIINNFAESGSIDKHDGYVSLSIIYAVFTFANFLAAPIVSCFGAKWAMTFGGLTYVIFQFGFLFLDKVFLYFSSALLGVGSAVIWTAQGKYLSLNSTEKTAGKHTGIFWAISQACLIFGGIFLFFVFHMSENNVEISTFTLRLLYGVFTSVTVVGICILAFLKMPSTQNILLERDELSNSNLQRGVDAIEVSLSNWQIIKSTVELINTKRMFVMIFAFCYTGVELSFWSGVYPTCISSTLKLGYDTNRLLALNAVALGLGQGVSGFLFGILNTKTSCLGRHRIVFLGAFVHFLTFIAIFINFPSDAPLGKTTNVGIINPNIAIALTCGFFLGFGDACWNTQIFAFLITRYSNQSTQAFSLFKFFQSMFTCAAFYCSKVLLLQSHLIILVIGLIVGSIGFYIADVPFSKNYEGERLSNSEVSQNINSELRTTSNVFH